MKIFFVICLFIALLLFRGYLLIWSVNAVFELGIVVNVASICGASIIFDMFDKLNFKDFTKLIE